jgi:hypothetical protein
LLVDRPDDIAGDVFEIAFVEWVQRVKFCGGEDAERGEGDGSGKNPKRRDQTSATEA